MDGNVNLAVQNEEQWRRLCRVALQSPELAVDPRYDSNEKRVAARHELEALIEEIFSTVPVADLELRLEKADVPFGRVNELDTVAQHPQLRARERFGTLEAPDGRILEALVSPFGIQGLPQQLKPVPGLGQHTAEILAEIEGEA
jgi:crotonobetainyl-CoA:carnitine CoA-transferase CaiB-like acyl-CoA transferase